MIEGIDTAATISADAAQKLRAEGVAFAGRYLVPSTMSKALTAAEAQRIRSAGLAIMLVWETTADRVKGGASVGVQDGKRARQLAQGMSVSTDAAIYFAVDYNAQSADYDDIEAYLRAAGAAVFPYGCGVYGSYYVVDEMRRRIPGLFGWQCVAWSSGKVSAAADVYQYQAQNGPEAKALAGKVGFAVDLDRCADLRKARLWLPTGYKEYADGEGGTIIEPGTSQTQARPWYADAMAWMRENGLYTEDRPNDTVTRAELATVIQRLCMGREAAYDPEYNRASGLLTDD